MRLALFGTPDFAVPALAAVAAAGHTIVRVYAQPPRPSGRGLKARPSPVERCAAAHGWPVHTPARLKGDAVTDFAALDLDAGVVVAYGLILPPAVLAAPRLGCLNIHASLLPRWRGAAPIQRAILAGDDETGITIMQMDAGLDTGPILLTRAVPIAGDATGGTLHDTLAALGAALIVEALAGLDAGRLTPQPQTEAGVSYAAKLSRAEGRLDWSRPAVELARQVHAFTPWPGAWCEHRGERLKVLAAAAVERPGEVAPAGPGTAAPGAVLDAELTVACGTGALRLERLQRAGKAPADAAAFLRGQPIPPGTVLT